jgi:D-alanyl-D-alanine carboxypeptidase (penicillin-binding protein 5/6)
MTRPSRSNAPRLLLVLALCTGLLLAAPSVCLAGEVTTSPQLAEAHSAIIEDSAGNVLWSQNPTDELAPASTTKIMTAVLALQSKIPLSTPVTVTDVTLEEDAQVAGFKAGDTTTLGDLMRVMLVYSANDAAVLVGRTVAGSDDAFVAMMNAKAQELGMTHTHFANCHGLEATDHYSCVQDLAALGRYALEHYPYISQTVQNRTVTVKVGTVDQTFESTDDLMESYRGLLGIKTGSVGSGDTFQTAFVGAARRTDTTLYTAVLGCKTAQGRFDDTERMLDWAWDAYSRLRLTTRNKVLSVSQFSYQFGWSCVVTASADTTGLAWPDGGDVTYTQIMTKHQLFADVGVPYGVQVWWQGKRCIGAASYETRKVLVPTESFGPFNSLLFVRPLPRG